MKKISYILMTLAVVASCTKTEISYDAPSHISIAPVAKVNTKAAVQTEYPTDLPLLVYANAGTSGNLASFTEVYLNDSEFTHASGVFTNATAYWPNVKALIFAGVSKSGNVTANNVEASFPTANTITVTGYNQPDTGNNDLMWFVDTNPKTAGSGNVNVEMKHACSWLVFKFYGDGVTSSATSPWKVTKVVAKNVYKTGTVTLGTSAGWESLSAQSDYVVYNDYAADATDATTVYETKGQQLNTSGVDISNNNNVLVIPQTPVSLEITYEFKSPAGNIIKEKKDVPLTFAGTSDVWTAGKKYNYNITIGTAQIKIAPTVGSWDEDINGPDVDGTGNPINKDVL